MLTKVIGSKVGVPRAVIRSGVDALAVATLAAMDGEI